MKFLAHRIVRKDVIAAILVGTFGALPVLLFSWMMLGIFERQQSERISLDLKRRAENLALVLHRKVQSELSLLQAIALSEKLRANDFVAFGEELRRAQKVLPHWPNVIVSDGSRQVFNLNLSPSENLPPVRDPSTVARLFETGRPQVGTFQRGTIGLFVPVPPGGPVRLSLAVPATVAWLLEDVERALLPAGWEAVLSDGDVIIGRTPAGAGLEDTSGDHLRASATVPELGWTVSVIAPPTSVTSEGVAVRAAVWGGAGLATMLTLLLASAGMFLWIERRANASLLIANRRLRTKRAFLNTLIRQAPVGIMITDAASGRFTALNAKARALLNGRTRATASLQPSDSIRRPDGQVLMKEDWPTQRALRKGETVEDEEVVLSLSGFPERHLLLSSAPIRDGSDRILAAVTVLIDVDAQRRAEAALRASERALRRSEEQLRLGARIGRFGVAEWEVEAGRIFWSSEIYKIYDVPREVTPTRAVLARIIHPDDRERVLAGLDRLEPDNDRILESEHRIIRPSGEIRWVAAQAKSALADADGKGMVRRITAVIQDITDRKKAEERFNVLQAELLHAARLNDMGQLAAAIAHELNQPLAAAANYLGGCRLQLRTLHAPSDEHEELDLALDLAKQQILRAGEIVRRLREFLFKAEREREICDPDEVVSDALSLALLGKAGNRVRYKLESSPCGPVLIDKIQVQQVVVNLVRNALEAMEHSPRRKLLIKLAKRGQFVEILVSDTGSGLSPAIQDRLFEPFASTKPLGMGIGLSLCRTIVEAHGGRIWAEPNPRGGTQFRFTIPCYTQQNQDCGNVA